MEMLVPRFCPKFGGNLLDGVCFHGSRNEDAFLSVIVIHGKFHGDDGTAIFHLKDIDVKPFSLYAPFSDEQGDFLGRTCFPTRIGSCSLILTP